MFDIPDRNSAYFMKNCLRMCPFMKYEVYDEIPSTNDAEGFATPKFKCIPYESSTYKDTEQVKPRAGLPCAS